MISWHQALAYALLGERCPELGSQDQPDVDALVEWLTTTGRVATAAAHAAECRARGEAWPHPVPAEWRVPAAQFAAALYAVRSRLGLLGSVAPPSGRHVLSADEQRLLREVPPHHG